VSHESNRLIAEKLREMADLLEVQQEDGYRVSAYRRAARTISELEQPLEKIAQERGANGLIELPGIGRGIAAAILEILGTGRWSQFDRLTGALDPEHLFQTVPGIGPGLAGRIHGELLVETLEQLVEAARDGRLERVSGIGPRRAQAIMGVLSERLGRRRYKSSGAVTTVPSVDDLLDVDREYLTKVAHGSLRKIAPKRFNPTGEAWLPVLHTRRGDWLFTVLFSNTQRAHELGKTNDWVVVYFHTEAAPEGQCTVVTEIRGPLEGKRVVRGRQGDCLAHYARTSEDLGPGDVLPHARKSNQREGP
jgi:Holliday junction resolvasome RuvABC DNA-binding subunit